MCWDLESLLCYLEVNLYFLKLQERRITPGEALNHAFVTLSHLVDYAHCSNVKASVQMMEVSILYKKTCSYESQILDSEYLYCVQ